jgi:hypothetical protein
MEVLYPCCCGLVVHKKSITACVLWAETKRKTRKEKGRFGTFTRELLALADWLRACGVTHAAMESTGVYWKPVWNILEGCVAKIEERTRIGSEADRDSDFRQPGRTLDR